MSEGIYDSPICDELEAIEEAVPIVVNRTMGAEDYVDMGMARSALNENWVTEIGLVNFLFNSFRYWTVRLLYWDAFKKQAEKS